MIIFMIMIMINLFHIIITTITMKKGWERGGSQEGVGCRCFSGHATRCNVMQLC